MDNKTEKLIEKLNAMAARQSVLEHLILALFDTIQDKTAVITKFTATTTLAHTADIDESMPKEFLLAFEKSRKVMLELLTHELKPAKA